MSPDVSFDLENVKSFVGSKRLTVKGDTENQKQWGAVRNSLLKQFPNLKLPKVWELDLETWGKFRRLAPQSINNNTLRNILIKQGYIGLSSKNIKSVWGGDFSPPSSGYGWSHIRVMFYRGIFGDWQEYGGGLPFARIRLPSTEIREGGAKYLSPINSGQGHIFWPYNLGAFARKCEPCKVFGSSHEGDDLEYAPRGDWLLTEGEDKSVISNLYGYPCIGLGGVDMFKSHKGGPINPWLFSFALNVDKLTIIYDSDAFQKPKVVAAQKRLCREFYNHATELAKISDTEGDAGGYYEEIWGNNDTEGLGAYGRPMANVNVAYTYLPPNPFSKGLDDILAVARGTWLDSLLLEAPSAFTLEVSEEEGKKGADTGKANKVKSQWLFTEPSKFGLLNFRLNSVQSNAVNLTRGALSAGWLQLNHWAPVGQKQSAVIYAWDQIKQIWEIAPVRNIANFSLTQWSRLSPGRGVMDGISGIVDAELSKFPHLVPNMGADGHRYMGVSGGDFDVTSGLMRGVHPTHNCFSRIDIRPFEGKPDKFIRFYADRMTGGIVDMERFLSFLAICIRDPGKVHVLGWITGKNSTGKSTLMKLVASVLTGWIKAEDLKNVFDADNANKGFMPLHLLGKSLIYDDDWKGGLSTRMIGRLNVLATNGEMAFRGMAKDPILCKPNMSALIISNQELIMSASDIEGFPRRIQKWEFKDASFSELDYQLAQAILEEEKGQLLWYLLNKNIEDCAEELRQFTHSQVDSIERDLAVNHSAEWLECLEQWATEHLFSLPDGNFKGSSSFSAASLNVLGSTLIKGRMSKDAGSLEGQPHHNYLPEIFGVRVENGYVEMLASSANWIRGIHNYEREEHNPTASHRGDRTTLKTLRGYIDTHPAMEFDNKARGGFAGDKIKGWSFKFLKPKD